ncbi:hypothetical protein BGX20_004757 [Mortierella sp. AD010]|nr:hypothetical protein BGX20_004757 [Mortierella sp. AD010]
MSFQGVPSNQVQWLLNKVKKGEAVSMDDFAKDFKYLYEVDAEKAYVTLLTNTTIVSQATRTAILNSYEVWRRNEGPAFWASQKAVLTVTNTAGELVIESGHVAKTLARKGRISVVSSQTEEFINGEGKETQKTPPQPGKLKSTQSCSGMPSGLPFVPKSVHSAGSKRKGIDAYSKHQAREKIQKTPVGRKAQTAVPEVPSILDSPSEQPPWSLTPSCSSNIPPPKHDRGRNSSISLDSGLEARLYVDPASFSVHKYVLNGHPVGQIFHQYQVAATKTVNNFDISASLKNIFHFMAMNYILATTEELEGISTEVLENIRHRFVWKATRLDISTAELCGRLDQQLTLGDDIHDDTVVPELRRIVVLYQMVALKLPLSYNQFENGLEDTYCHQVIDALFAYQFPTRSRSFVINWANGEAHGSKKRRGHGYKPDGVITRNGRQIGFLEVKPPGSCHNVKEYLYDYWNLSNFAKDAIDDFLQQGLAIVKVAAVQVFSK